MVCPSEAVLSHIEMYCDFIDLSSQEGDVSRAINHVVCTITKAGGVHTALLDKQVNCTSQRLGDMHTALQDKQVKSGV